VSHEKPVMRSAQDDDFVGVLKKNIVGERRLRQFARLNPE